MRTHFTRQSEFLSAPWSSKTPVKPYVVPARRSKTEGAEEELSNVRISILGAIGLLLLVGLFAVTLVTLSSTA